MALEPAVSQLHRELKQLHEALLDLTVTLSEDQPHRGRVAMTQRWADTAENVRGLLREALERSVEAKEAVGPPADLDRLVRALGRCQKAYNDVVRAWVSEMASYERAQEMSLFGRERGGEWKAWISGLALALERCYEPLSGAGRALLGSWQEVSGRAGGVSVTVNASGVGRQLNLGNSGVSLAEEMQ